ncbi:MAG: class II aldolase/adducin family protein [Chloroflexota bacterium]
MVEAGKLGAAGWTGAQPPDQALVEAVIATARWMVDHDYASGTAGNVSVRLAEDAFLITPSALDYFRMEADDLGICGLDAQHLSGRQKPSSEAKMHAAIYRCRPEVTAVIHFHPVHASAYAYARKSIPVASGALRIFNGGSVPVVPFAPSGSWDLADAVARALGNRDAALLASHGAVAVGRDLGAARHLVALVERTARICLLAEALGGAVDVSGEMGAE